MRIFFSVHVCNGTTGKVHHHYSCLRPLFTSCKKAAIEFASDIINRSGYTDNDFSQSEESIALDGRGRVLARYSRIGKEIVGRVLKHPNVLDEKDIVKYELRNWVI